MRYEMYGRKTFSCRTRNFCSNRQAKRSVLSAEKLNTEILASVAQRHWTFSLPRGLRGLLERDRLPLPSLDTAAVMQVFRRLLLERLRQAERLSESFMHNLLYYRTGGGRSHPGPSGKRAPPGEGSFRTPRSAQRPHPLSAIMSSVAGKPSGCRPGTRPAGACPSTCASLNGQRGTRGRQRIAGLSAARKPISARQFAACPEFSPGFLPFLSDFPLCSRIETLISYEEIRDVLLEAQFGYHPSRQVLQSNDVRRQLTIVVPASHIIFVFWRNHV